MEAVLKVEAFTGSVLLCLPWKRGTGLDSVIYLVSPIFSRLGLKEAWERQKSRKERGGGGDLDWRPALGTVAHLLATLRGRRSHLK